MLKHNQQLDGSRLMEFDTKIAIVLRNDLQIWQWLNVCAFLTTGLIGQNSDLIGDAYIDKDGNIFNGLAKQPIIILSSSGDTLKKIHCKALARGIKSSAFVEEMFETGFDAANRAEFAKYSADTANIVGLALHADRKLVDKITKGAKMTFTPPVSP
jgi:hypothetical protein